MRNSIFKFILGISFTIGFSCYGFSQDVEILNRNLNQEIITVLEGEIIGKKVDSLYLFKAADDKRGKRRTIPVRNGFFNYILKSDSKEAYELIYPYQLEENAWNPVLFFSDSDTISFKIHPENFQKDTFQGGSLTLEYNGFMDSLVSHIQPQIEEVYKKTELLKKNNQYYSDSAKIVHKKLESIQSKQEKDDLRAKLKGLEKTHADKTTKAKNYTIKLDSLVQAYYDSEKQYITSHTSPVSYYLLYKRAQQSESGFLSEQYKKHAKAFPNHPYTYLVRQLLKANEEISVGGNFVNFKAPTIAGKEKNFSNLIEDKITLLNLWASWCGPCIRKSREIVPIYEKYNSEQFTVVGVAREFENTKKLEQALERENFPWLNLVDLDDENKIWLKYGIPYSGGGMFLISRRGEILAIDPTAEKARKILDQRL